VALLWNGKPNGRPRERVEVGDQSDWIRGRYGIDASFYGPKNFRNKPIVGVRVYGTTFALACESLEVERQQEKYPGAIAI